MFKECSWCRVTLGGRSNSTRGMRRDVSVLSDCQRRAVLHSAATNTLTSATLRSLETLLLLTEEWDIDYKMLMLRGGWGVLRYCQVVIMEDSSLWNKLLWPVLLVQYLQTGVCIYNMGLQWVWYCIINSWLLLHTLIFSWDLKIEPKTLQSRNTPTCYFFEFEYLEVRDSQIHNGCTQVVIFLQFFIHNFTNLLYPNTQSNLQSYTATFPLYTYTVYYYIHYTYIFTRK